MAESINLADLCRRLESIPGPFAQAMREDIARAVSSGKVRDLEKTWGSVLVATRGETTTIKVIVEREGG